MWVNKDVRWLSRRRSRCAVGDSTQTRELHRSSSPKRTPTEPVMPRVTAALQIAMVDPERASSVDDAVYHAVLYADIFDYPLTRDEIFTFALAPATSRSEVEQSIDRLLACGTLETDSTFVYCPARACLVTRRLVRQQQSHRAWQRARFYASILWALPYVRMVAVTGALAMNNVDPGDDIDYLIVTEPGRLWLTRGFIVGIAKLVRACGDTLCPNYLISSRALRMDRRDLYVAHELAQMVPIHGQAMAARLWAENAWCRDLLPNAYCRELDRTSDRLPVGVRLVKALAQTLLWLPPGDWVEQWEQRRKVAKLSGQVPPHVGEALYTADVCKGHDHGHGERIMQLWQSRTAAREYATASVGACPVEHVSGHGD